MKRFSLLSISALFLLLCLSSCLSYKPITFGETGNIHLKEFKDNTLTFSFDQDIQNPNGYAIKIKNPKLALKIGNTTVQRVSCTPKIKLKPGSDERYTIEVSANSESLLKAAGQLMTGQTKKVELQGSIRAGVFLFSKKVPVHYTLKF